MRQHDAEVTVTGQVSRVDGDTVLGHDGPGVGHGLGHRYILRESSGWIFPLGPLEGIPVVSSAVKQVCQQAQAAAVVTRELTTAAKDEVLLALAEAIDTGRDGLKAANAADVEAAREAGVSATLVDRLTLTDVRIGAMLNAVRTVVGLPDPVGQMLRGAVRPNGLLIE